MTIYTLTHLDVENYMLRCFSPSYLSNQKHKHNANVEGDGGRGLLKNWERKLTNYTIQSVNLWAYSRKREEGKQSHLSKSFQPWKPHQRSFHPFPNNDLTWVIYWWDYICEKRKRSKLSSSSTRVSVLLGPKTALPRTAQCVRWRWTRYRESIIFFWIDDKYNK